MANMLQLLLIVTRRLSIFHSRIPRMLGAYYVPSVKPGTGYNRRKATVSALLSLWPTLRSPGPGVLVCHLRVWSYTRWGVPPARSLDGPSVRISREVLFKLSSGSPGVPGRNGHEWGAQTAEGTLGPPPCLRPGLHLFSCFISLFENCCFGGRGWAAWLLDLF